MKGDVINKLEQSTGQKYEPTEKVFGNSIRMGDYVSSQLNFIAVKEPFGNLLPIMKKYGYDTDITYEHIICGEESYDGNYYDNLYNLIAQIYDMVDKNYKDMTLNEKADIYIFLYAASNISGYDRDRRNLYMYGEMDRWADENNIKSSKRNMGNPDYAKKDEEVSNEIITLWRRHDLMYPCAETMIRASSEKLFNRYPERWKDLLSPDSW